jgi:ssDNA-binding Zn-finger/Zn-ribbon topoisomerase 1
MEFEGYCVKCRKKQVVKNGVVEQTAKGRRMAKGTCPECGTKMTRFLSSKDAG